PATTGNSVGTAQGRGVFNNARLPYGRCPSDDYQPDATVSNYVGSLGPQCAIGNCGFDPNQKYCQTAIGWGYVTSPAPGNPINTDELRGLFNRLGAKVAFPAGIVDGTSNTIMIGESLPGSHDHLAGNNWWGYNNGSSHCTTIIPINNFMPEDKDRPTAM